MLYRLHPLLPAGCSTSSAASRAAAHQWSARSRKTGRICGNCVLPRQAWRYDAAIGKGFQRQLGRRFGFELGLEDRMLLASLGQRHRRLDEKKMKQLSEILGMKVEEAASANEDVARLAVQFSKIKVNTSFTEVAIHWICKGENDEEIASVLEKEKHSLRRSLSDAVGTNCPELRFVPDKTELLLEEMDRLFKKADYGTDYRTLSHTARVLGNVGEEEDAKTRKPPKQKPPPSWKQEILRKKGLL